MQNTGESEQSPTQKTPSKLTLSFWQSFLLTLAGAAVLISLVANGPAGLTYFGIGSTIVLLLWIIFDRAKKKP